MQLAIQTQLHPDVHQIRALEATVRRFNAAAELKRDRSIRPHFRPLAAMPYDARILSRKGDAVSILTLQVKAAAQRAAGKRPKAVRRKLKTIARKEARFRRDVNHCISKKLVRLAKDTGRGIALELLTHIRGRTRFRKSRRARMSGWSFAQLRGFIDYKATLAGVLALVVSPRNTSRQCFACKRIDKANRRSQSEFACMGCGHIDHADINAARNISYRAEVSLPIVSMLVLLGDLASGTSLGVQAEVA